eukprot:9458588-Pyramimonas_sp.AAC.1
MKGELTLLRLVPEAVVPNMFIALFEVSKQDTNKLTLVMVKVISHSLTPHSVRRRPVGGHIKVRAGRTAGFPSPAVVGEALRIKSGRRLVKSYRPSALQRFPVQSNDELSETLWA